jgi:colanic acid/amylovoran biosynthesis protein
MFRMALYALALLMASLLYRLWRVRLHLRNADRRNLLNAYYEADLVLSCGGGNFYAHHSPSPGFLWALAAIALPLGMGKPVVMLPQSVGPIEGREQRALARWVFRRISLIMVREERSRQFLREILDVGSEIMVLPDLAFTRPANISAGAHQTRPLTIGVTVIDRGAQTGGAVNQAAYEQSLATTLAIAQREHKADVHLFVQCLGPSLDQDDRRATQRLADELARRNVRTRLHDNFDDAGALRRALAEMDLIVASRMHTGIFALSSGVPVVMIAYQPKAIGVMASFGLDDYCLDIATLSADSLGAAIRRATAERETLAGQIASTYATMEPELQRWEQLLAEGSWRR